MDNLKLCPFCGSEAEATPSGYVSCSNLTCPADGVISTIEEWNNRPIEDALQAKLYEEQIEANEYKNLYEIVKAKLDTRQKQWMNSYDEVCNRADTLQAKLDIAREGLVRVRDWEFDIMGDCVYDARDMANIILNKIGDTE